MFTNWYLLGALCHLIGQAPDREFCLSLNSVFELDVCVIPKRLVHLLVLSSSNSLRAGRAEFELDSDPITRLVGPLYLLVAKPSQATSRRA